MTDTTVEAPATPRLKVKYNEQIIPELEKEFKYSNPMQVARVQKVVVSMGVGAAARDSKLIEGAVKDLTLITGQKPKITKAKKSVAQFHLREGQAIALRHPAWRAHVGVPGSPSDHGSAAYPRFPRHQRRPVRWSGNYTLASPSSPCSTRSIRIRSITSVVWTSPW